MNELKMKVKQQHCSYEIIEWVFNYVDLSCFPRK
jgi:hypothetical protein